MSNYKSKHSGAQVDEAVSKVLSGEVGGGADWNANEGEAGYIKNNPFEIKKFNSIITKDDNYTLKFMTADDEADLLNLEYYKVNHYIQYGQDIYKLNQQDFNIPNGKNTFTITYNQGYYYLSATKYDADGLLENIEYGDLKIFFIINYIDVLFLDDTVIKTTPQSLSDADKNQALANLGIDPVVWKYMCEPIVIESGINIPADLLEKINSLNDTNYSYYLFLCNVIFVTDSMDRPSKIKTFDYLEDVTTENSGVFGRCLRIYPETVDIAELCIDLDTGTVDYES
jgi:hypothetical protein